MRRERIRTALALCTLVFVFAACGTKRGLSVAESTQPSQHDSVPGSPGRAAKIEDTRKAAASGNLYCPFPGECQEAVVMISVITDDGLERCTGFLISDTEVMTNDHCIDKSVSVKGWETRRKNIPCRDFVYAHFVGSDPTAPGMTVGCETIEVRSGETGIGSQDYAVLKLQNRVTDREPVKLSPRGFRDAEDATVFRVQMTSDGTQTGFHGMQTKLDCRASYSTFLYPGVTAPQSLLMTFGDCAIQAGNSGSPIFNTDGMVGALVQGYLTPRQDPQITAQLQANLLDQSYGQVGIGSQLTCMHDVPGEAQHSCAPVIDAPGMMPEEYLASFGSFSAASLPALDPALEWREILPDTALSKIFTAVPKCADDIRFDSIVMPFKKGLNRFMQAEWRAQNEMNERHSPFQSTLGSRVYVSDTLGSLNVPACNAVSITMPTPAPGTPGGSPITPPGGPVISPPGTTPVVVLPPAISGPGPGPGGPPSFGFPPHNS